MPLSLRRVHALPRPASAREVWDLTVATGEVVALAGRAGSGKSTLVDVLLGRARPDRGTVRVFGRPPAAATAAGLVDGLGRLTVQQRAGVVGAVVAELTAGTGRTPDEVLATVGLADRADRSVRSLSVGERLRVRLGAALARSAPLLVLDDPTAELDGTDLHEFGRTARAHAERGRTIVLTCRRLQDAAACAERLVVVERGRLVADTGRLADHHRLRSLRRLTARVGGALPVDVLALPAVRSAVVTGDRLSVLSADGDATLRALLVRYPQATSIAIVEPTLPDLLVAFSGPG